MSETRVTLTCRRHRTTTETEITGTHLICRWAVRRQSGEKRILLSHLSPDLSHSTTRPEKTDACGADDTKRSGDTSNPVRHSYCIVGVFSC